MNDPFVPTLIEVTIVHDYVNMADVISSTPASPPRARTASARVAATTRSAAAVPTRTEESGAEVPQYDLIELLFFAYRAFIGRPDRVLAEFGFGRAHHRVLHFVVRNPGIRVADLLDILKITKQSLGRVLKQLIDTGFIDQRPGPDDRRERLLHATEAGKQLSFRLSMLQSRQIEAALKGLGPEGAEDVRRFLTLLAATDAGEKRTGAAADADEEDA